MRRKTLQFFIRLLLKKQKKTAINYLYTLISEYYIHNSVFPCLLLLNS
ncbi:Uncharacterized protein dnm_003920 [Desulfonema magnum]|uniref:Uncharacterized protein n=1 Tax=Desulfonema magnum TaxID=45655 RepID=A0A975BFK3_9BACT|nr:Uncharacterized protein dnm_003920 [Desulfonema magnum]